MAQQTQKSPVKTAHLEAAFAATKWANKAIIWWLPILYLLIADSFYLRTYDSAQVKITLVQMGGICMFSLWMCRLIEEGRGLFNKSDLATLAPFMAYFAWGIISFMHAPYKYSSLDGFLRRVFYMTVPLIVIREFDEKGTTRLTRILIVASWITIGYGMLQWFDVTFFPKPGPGNGPDPFIWRGAFTPRVFSTFGNPNFFGNFLVLLFPILVCQFLKTRRFSLLVLLGMLFWNLVSTGTKGAWLGFTAATLFLAGTYFWFFDRETLRAHAKKLVLAGVIAAVTGVGGVLFKLQQDPRLTSMNFRLHTWEATWEMITTQPLMGTGIWSFWTIYPAFRHPAIFHIEGKHNTETDHAEDEWLEVLFDEGIIGFGIFLWMIVSACAIAYGALGQMTAGLKKDQRAPPRAYDLLGYLVAFQAMLAHNTFDVSMRFVSSGVFLGLLSGMVVNLSRGMSLAELHEREGAALEPSTSAWQTVSTFLIWPARLVGVGALAWAAFTFVTEFSKLQGPLYTMQLGGEILQWWISWGSFLFVIGAQVVIFARLTWLSRNALVPLLVAGMMWPLHTSWGLFKADVHHNIAIFFSKQKNWEQALKNYLEVGRLNPAYVMSFYFKGNVFNDRFDMRKVSNENWGDKPGQSRDDFERALDSYEQVRGKAPNYVQMHHQVGILYLKRADWERSQSRPAEAEKYVDLALARFRLYTMHDPVFAPNWHRIAEIHLTRQQYDQAIDAYKNLLEAPNCAPEQWLADNPRMRKTIMAYQEFYEKDGRWQHLHPDPDAYSRLGNAYFLKGDLSGAEKAYKDALHFDKGNQMAQRNLQVVYAKAQAEGRLKLTPPAVPGQPPTVELLPKKG
ncbi:MAG: O-antigen ligase family protein [Elusimicrobia bacterium]|nr:O-antigen ligase family protein [Elusimicrobiota bacterium]